MAALAYHFGYKTDLKHLFNFLSFFKQTSSISYIFAGSFSRYLVDKYGIEKYKKLYSDLDFKKIYGTTIDTLNMDYSKFLDNIQTKGNADKAYYYFGRKSIFYKVCPRYIASRLIDAWELYRKKRYEEAKDIFENIFKLGKNYSALIGMAECESELGQNDKAINLLEKNLSFYKNSAYYYNIEFSLGDLQVKQGDLSGADTNYTSLMNENPNRRYYYLTRLRKFLMKDNLIKVYISGNDSDKFQVIKKINSGKYFYNSIPVYLNLARALKEEYKLFIKNFDKTIHINDYSSSYAVYKLSIYMLENLDFINARKMAALSLRYNSDKNFNYILQSNFDLTDWFFNNGEKTLKQFHYKYE